MPSRQGLLKMFLVAFSILGLLTLPPAMTSAAPGPTADDGGMEVMTRGPIHEAFADVSANQAKPAVVISGNVPEPIKEVPPDYRPEGGNVQWISGYWSWDDDQNDFIWVSGIWRDIPPGRQWIPGYWMAVSGGNQFVSGYWTDIEQPETVYLPPPPQPLQAVPGTPVSSPDSLWIDGHWLWSGDGYVWQAGHWLRQRPDMIWIPSHYVWTPRGYVFVRGYWDYQFGRRGVLFAPRYYQRPIYRSHDYYYTPTIVLNIDTIFLSLFIRRDHHHYYFGDYHDVRYERRGFLPWYSRHATRYGYDPCYRSYRWRHMRDDRQWEHRYHEQYRYRRDHHEARPPVFYRPHERHAVARSQGGPDHTLGRPLAEVVDKRDHPVRFTRLDQDHKREYQNRERKLADFQNERRRVEIEPDREGRPRRDGDIKRPDRVRLSASPIVDTSVNTSTPAPEKYPERRRGRDQDNRRPDPQERTDRGLQGEQVEGNQPSGRKDNLGNDQPRQQRQDRQQRRQLPEAAADQPESQPQMKPPKRVPQNRENQPNGSSPGYQQGSEPVQVDSLNPEQPRNQRQRRQNTGVEAQPDVQPQMKPPKRVRQRAPQDGENQSGSPPQGYQQENQPMNIDNRNSIQPQRRQQRREPVAVEEQRGSQPQTRMKQSGRTSQGVENPTEGQPQVFQQRNQRQRVERRTEGQPQVRQDSQPQMRQDGQPQMRQKRRQPQEAESQRNGGPEVDQQRNQSRRMDQQRNDQPQNKQRVKRPLPPEEQAAEQAQREEQKGANRQ